MLNKCLAALSILGLLFIGVITGTILSYYKLPPSALASEALRWVESWQEIHRSSANSQIDRRKTAGKKPPPTVYWNQDKALNGVTLITRMRNSKVDLITMDGTVIHQWDAPFKKAWLNPKQLLNKHPFLSYIHTAHVFPNGDLLAQYSVGGNTPYGGGIARYDKDGNLLWTYDENAHHGFYVDPGNGDIYALIHKMIMDSPPGFEKLSFPMLVDYIVRLTPEGKELQRVSLLEAFKHSPYYSLLFFGRKNEIWDRFHTNSVIKLEPELASKFPMFKAGQLLISIRNPSIIAMVDLQKPQVVWAAKGEWRMQHEAQFASDGSILLFDNQGTRQRSSRVLSIRPETKEPIKEWATKGDKKFYTPIYGKVQMLENGNILVIAPFQRNAFEMTPEGNVVWDYQHAPYMGKLILTARRYTLKELPFLYEKAPGR